MLLLSTIPAQFLVSDLTYRSPLTPERLCWPANQGGPIFERSRNHQIAPRVRMSVGIILGRGLKQRLLYYQTARVSPTAYHEAFPPRIVAPIFTT